MSRYSSIASSSSRRVTKCSWLRSSRRSSPDSLTISIRAVSGCERISDEIDVSVLNRKCGLIWLASASRRAAISSFSCSCSRCSMRALFQILIGIATREHRREQDDEPHRRRRRGVVQAGTSGWASDSPSACSMISRPIGAASRITTQSISNRRTSRQTCRCRPVKNSGENCQIASFGQISRRPPPANPQPTAKGSAIHSPAMNGGMPTMTPTMAPAYGPASSPARNAPGERQVGGVVVEQEPRRRPRPSAGARGWRQRSAAPASRASRSAGCAETTETAPASWPARRRPPA